MAGRVSKRRCAITVLMPLMLICILLGVSACESNSETALPVEQAYISEGFSEEQARAAAELIEARLQMQNTSLDDAPEALQVAMDACDDVCAWLCVPGTNVSVPVCWREQDDMYYERHDLSGGTSLGEAFVAGANSPDFSDPVTVVYGHSFDDVAASFTQLHQFEEEDFFETHNTFYIVVPSNILKYEIISARKVSDADILASNDFSNSLWLQAYFNFTVDSEVPYGYVRKNAALNANSDRILQLSTCTLPAEEHARYLVTGVLVS